ncbi:8731_t:CDS:1, partial [Cetraspora pellucida]
MDDTNIENVDVEKAIAEAEANTDNNNNVGLDKVDVLCSLNFISLLSNWLGCFKVLKFKK